MVVGWVGVLLPPFCSTTGLGEAERAAGVVVVVLGVTGEATDVDPVDCRGSGRLDNSASDVLDVTIGGHCLKMAGLRRIIEKVPSR